MQKNSNLQLTKNKGHNIIHQLLMIIFSEFINILWLATAVSMTLGGVALFEYANDWAFYKLAFGLPLLLLGISVTLFKIHELILVIVRPKRLKAICIFCKKD